MRRRRDGSKALYVGHVEAGARHLKSRAVTGVIVLTGALAATAGLSGSAAAAELTVSQLPAASTAASVAAGAVSSVPVAPVVDGATTTVRPAVEQTIAASPSAPVAEPAVRAVARTAEAPARVIPQTPVAKPPSPMPSTPATPSTPSEAPVAGDPGNAGPNGQPDRSRTPSRRSQAEADDGAPKPAAPAAFPAKTSSGTAGELSPTHPAGARSAGPDQAPLPAPPPAGAAASAASASAFAPFLAGMALLALALGLSDPGVSRRLKLPSAAWRPQNLVFRLERPG